MLVQGMHAVKCLYKDDDTRFKKNTPPKTFNGIREGRKERAGGRERERASLMSSSELKSEIRPISVLMVGMSSFKGWKPRVELEKRRLAKIMPKHTAPT